MAERNEEIVPSNSEGTSLLVSNGPSSRHPTCALCKHHGQISFLKGHKRCCAYRHCNCQLCHATNEKRDFNAKQVASRRAQALDEELRTETPPFPLAAIGSVSPLLPPSSASGNQAQDNNSGISSGLGPFGNHTQSIFLIIMFHVIIFIGLSSFLRPKFPWITTFTF